MEIIFETHPAIADSCGKLARSVKENWLPRLWSMSSDMGTDCLLMSSNSVLKP